MNRQLYIDGLPLFDLVLTDEEDMMTCISIVDDPAVQRDFLAFKSNERMVFRVDVERCITGVAIRADVPIYRRNGDYEYYIRFTKDTIKRIVERYSKDGLWNSVSLQHDGNNVSGVTMREMYIKDSTKGISPKGFEDVEEGSLFVTFHIEDAALWDEIVGGDTLNGFSIEIYGTMEPALFSNEQPETLDSLVEDALADKKKVDTKLVAVTDVRQLMEDSVVADIALRDGSTLRNAQVYAIGEENGQNVAVIYHNEVGDDKWSIVKVRDIKGATPAASAWRSWNDVARGKAWEDAQEIVDTISVTETNVISSNDMAAIIGERRWVMINYNDAQPSPHTGARQCMVVAWGISKAGNECIRVYEKYGDSRSGGIADYRLLLTSRITSLRVLDYVEPWQLSDLDSRYNNTGDESMSVIFEYAH